MSKRMGICVVPECTLEATRKSMCQRHYKRARKHGSPYLGEKKILNLSEGERKAYDKSYNSTYHLKNRSRLIVQTRDYYKRNRTRLIAKSVEWGRKHTNQYLRKDMRLRCLFGIGLKEFDAIADSQGNLCAICLRPEKLYVDHDHETNQIRGLICNDCNLTLGRFRAPASAYEEYLKRAGITKVS